MAKRTRKKRVRPPMGRSSPLSPVDLETYDASSGLLNALVDTPRGSSIKFKYSLEKRCYTIAHVLPPGTVFPFDFGSIPRTAAQDGDPLDVLIMMEWPSFAGCLVPVRLIGALEAEQTQEGGTFRNDRLIGVAERSRVYRDSKTLSDLEGGLLRELEHFFVSYNEERGRKFKVLDRVGPDRARRLVEGGQSRFRKDHRRRAR